MIIQNIAGVYVALARIGSDGFYIGYGRSFSEALLDCLMKY